MLRDTAPGVCGQPQVQEIGDCSLLFLVESYHGLQRRNSSGHPGVRGSLLELVGWVSVYIKRGR